MTHSFFNTRAFLAGLLLVCAALFRFGLVPGLLDLPVDYANETRYAAESRYRESPDGQWQNVTVIARRVDQTQVTAGQVAVIQGDMHWFTDDGKVIFENTGLYGVNRRTRLNVSGYGDIDRTGFFLFPPHLRQGDFTYWDPLFIGARQASFDHLESLEGLLIYVYQFIGSTMDETAGYSYLPVVPELYRTLTDGQGTLWIEPLSGILVDYQEQGTSYFVDAGSGERVANFYEWSDRYTPETRAAQFSLARQTRLRIQVLEIWFPGALVLAGLVLLGLQLFQMDYLKRLKP
jgi:hypothetical protein